MRRLREFKEAHSFVGAHNIEDVDRAFGAVDFPAEARPVGEEGIAENGRQLFALCEQDGVTHLIYCGFAVDWCLLMAAGGMMDMGKYGLMCSVLREATTAGS